MWKEVASDVRRSPEPHFKGPKLNFFQTRKKLFTRYLMRKVVAQMRQRFSPPLPQPCISSRFDHALTPNVQAQDKVRSDKSAHSGTDRAQIEYSLERFLQPVDNLNCTKNFGFGRRRYVLPR